MFAHRCRDMEGCKVEKLTFYKCTAPGGIAHHDGKTRYVVGERLSIADPSPAEHGACGRGLHVVSQLAYIKNYVSGDKLAKAEFYEVEVDAADVIATDETKTRVSSLRVVRRVTERDFGVRRGSLAALVGYGYGYGDGDGYGDAAGKAEGEGDGVDDGAADVDADGDGYGVGGGVGYGGGDGYGDGGGDGDGSGYGSGYGYGYGDGDGDGDGE